MLMLLLLLLYTVASMISRSRILGDAHVDCEKRRAYLAAANAGMHYEGATTKNTTRMMNRNINLSIKHKLGLSSLAFIPPVAFNFQ